MVQASVLTTVAVLIWFANIALSNGRLLEYLGMVLGSILVGMVAIGFQLNKPQPEFRGFDGYQQERIGFAIAASQMLPEYRKDLIRDADTIVKAMDNYNIILNKPFVREVMNYHLNNTPDYWWDEFRIRAKKQYKH